MQSDPFGLIVQTTYSADYENINIVFMNNVKK